MVSHVLLISGMAGHKVALLKVFLLLISKRSDTNITTMILILSYK